MVNGPFSHLIQPRLSVYPHRMPRAYSRLTLLGSVAALALLSPSAQAWYDHRVVMKWILTRLETEVPLPLKSWNGNVPTVAVSPETHYSELASLLLLQQNAQLISVDAKTYHELLLLAAEDPDYGMDRDLPDSADPSDDRRFMGGTTGPTSQGFRHMYWPGWEWKHPIATFQYPPHTLGQSPDRIELLANEARTRIRRGDLVWGLRILGWALHYIQDLTQPFHTVQFPSLKIIPLEALLTWPPRDIFPHFVAETTRVVTNYHWAYEGYARYALLLGDASPFKDCFAKSGGSLLATSPRDLALQVTSRSRKRAPKVGAALMEFIGTRLKDKGVNLVLNPKQISYEDLLENPVYETARLRLNAETCESFQLATDASVWLVRWAFAK